MNKYVLIGGGNVGRGNTSYETEIIDNEIVKMTNKDKPNLLFVGLASSFSDSYYDTIKKIYKNLGCETSYLKKKNIINNPNIVEDKIKNADIIYFCGGDSLKLVTDIKNHLIDKLLEEKDNCIFVGMSAGAILFSNKGYSDSLILRGEADKYDYVDGLGLVNISICPHYDDNEKRKELKGELFDTIYGIPSKTCLIIEDNKYRVLGDSKVYKCYMDNNNFVEEVLKDEGVIS